MTTVTPGAKIAGEESAHCGQGSVRRQGGKPVTSPLVIGLDLSAVHARFDQLEALMATAAEEITALTGRFDALNAVVVDIHADFLAFRESCAGSRAWACSSASARNPSLDAALHVKLVNRSSEWPIHDRVKSRTRSSEL